MRGVCFIWGVGSRGLDLKFTIVGSLLVTRRERREGVFSGWWWSDDDEPLSPPPFGVVDVVVVKPTAPPVVSVDGAVSVLPNENEELIDAPIFFCMFLLQLFQSRLFDGDLQCSIFANVFLRRNY